MSGLIVDEGCTVVVEGLRVCPSERGRGVAGVIQRFGSFFMIYLFIDLFFDTQQKRTATNIVNTK